MLLEWLLGLDWGLDCRRVLSEESAADFGRL